MVFNSGSLIDFVFRHFLIRLFIFLIGSKHVLAEVQSITSTTHSYTVFPSTLTVA